MTIMMGRSSNTKSLPSPMTEMTLLRLGAMALVLAVVVPWLFLNSLVQIAGRSSSGGDGWNENNVLWDKSNDGNDTVKKTTAFPWHLYHFPGPAIASTENCYPKGIHLAQGSNALAIDQQKREGLFWSNNNNKKNQHKLNVTVSFRLSCPPALARPQVLYGVNQHHFHNQQGILATPKPLQFNYTSNHSSPGKVVHYHSDWIYHVTMTNIEAGVRRYWYKIRVHFDRHNDDGVERNNHGLLFQRSSFLRGTTTMLETPSYSFWTPPLPGQPTTLALVGDLGQTVNSSKTVRHIFKAIHNKNNNPQNNNHRHTVTQILIAGDMSYADSDPYRWPSFFALHEPLFRSTLLQVAVGNHEIECDTVTRRPFVQYEHYFYNPNRLGPAQIEAIPQDYIDTLYQHSCSTPSTFEGHYDYGNAYYTYTHGLARIVVLNSYGDTSVGSRQYQFMEQTLREHAREKKQQQLHQEIRVHPWLIVSFHSPFYTTFVGHVNETQAVDMKAAMEPLFVQYEVNFVICGHDHAYLRTKPMYHGRAVPNGRAPIYLTLGAGGNREQHSAGYQHDKPEPWVAMRDISDYGYGHLHLPNATHAKFVWVRDGTTDLGVHDVVWLRHQYSDHDGDKTANG